MNIQPASTVVRRIYVSAAFFRYFWWGKGHAHRWDLLTSDMKKFKALIDKDGFLLGVGCEPGFARFLWDSCFAIAKKKRIMSVQKVHWNCELSPQKTHYKFPGTWSSQIIFTKSFLMPNPLSWGLLGRFPKSLAVNGDPRNCVTSGGFECGGQTVKVFV